MYLFYFDEVKIDPPKQESFWLGGIGVPASKAQEVESELNSISVKWFGSGILGVENEFHGRDIIHGKGNLKGVDIMHRADLFQDLLEADRK